MHVYYTCMCVYEVWLGRAFIEKDCGMEMLLGIYNLSPKLERIPNTHNFRVYLDAIDQLS